MKDAAAIAASIESTIDHIYRRPGMHGVTSAEIDTLLWHLHVLWWDIHEREPGALTDLILEAHGGGHRCNMGFAGHFRLCVPGGREAGEETNRDHVIAAWRRLDEVIGLPMPGGSSS